MPALPDVCLKSVPEVAPVQLDQNRADLLEFLYRMDGRDQPDHPQAHTYTGLFQGYAQAIGVAYLQDLARDWHDYEQRASLLALGDAEG